MNKILSSIVLLFMISCGDVNIDAYPKINADVDLKTEILGNWVYQEPKINNTLNFDLEKP